MEERPLSVARLAADHFDQWEWEAGYITGIREAFNDLERGIDRDEGDMADLSDRQKRSRFVVGFLSGYGRTKGGQL